MDLNAPTEQIPAVKQFMSQAFPRCSVLEHHDRNIKFRVPKVGLSLILI